MKNPTKPNVLEMFARFKRLKMNRPLHIRTCIRAISSDINICRLINGGTDRYQYTK